MLNKFKSFWQSNPILAKLRRVSIRERYGELSKGKKTLVIVGSLALIAVAWWAYGIYSLRNQQTALGSGFQFEPVETGILEETIDATGNIRAAQASALSWQSSGIVESVDVAEGDRVLRGDTLATLEQSSLPASVLTAQAELLDAKEALDDFYASYTGVALAEAQQAVADAQDAYEDALYTYNSLISTAGDLAVENAYGDVVLALEDLKEARREYKKFNEKPRENLNRIRTLQIYYDYQTIYDEAVRVYNSLTSTGTDTQILVAEAGVAVAEAVFQEAQAEFDRLVAGPTEEEIAAAEAQYAAAETAMKQAMIEAPFDGVVALAAPQVGDYVQESDTAFELINAEHFYMDVLVNELDIDKIQVGQSATIILDAFQDDEYEAEVVKVGAIGDDSSGVVSYTVVVELLELNEKVRSGMTATVEILITASKETLLVPNQAVRLENGQQVVYVMTPGEGMQAVPVTLGSSSDVYTQVLEGELEAGDLVVLNPETTSEGGELSGPGGFFFGGDPPVRQTIRSGEGDGGPQIERGSFSNDGNPE